MKKVSLLIVAVTVMAGATVRAEPPIPISGANLGSVDGGDFKMAHEIIDKNCISCHTSKRIDRAISAHQDLNAIEMAMEARGARLTPQEREVLGIYWKKSPLFKEKK